MLINMPATIPNKTINTTPFWITEPANALTLTHLVSTSKHWFPEPEETNDAKEESKNQAPNHFFVCALNTCSNKIPMSTCCPYPYPHPDTTLTAIRQCLIAVINPLFLKVTCILGILYNTCGGGDCMSAIEIILFTWKWWYTSFQTPYHQLQSHEYDETLNVCLEYLPQRTLLLATDQIPWVSVIAAHCSICTRHTIRSWSSLFLRWLTWWCLLGI